MADRMINEHNVTTTDALGEDLTGPHELIVLDRRVASAVLFDGAWRLRPEHDRLWADLEDGPTIRIVFDLADGRHVGYTGWDEESVRWVACRVDDQHVVDDLADIPVFGSSLAVLLEAAMDFGGDVSSLRTEALADLEFEPQAALVFPADPE
ncbi:hypothetical protein [Kibdelosporangium philippinense]|uniref:hypothetical protein n=1 Tax=Kibdelosporangium philippinense TaxID=211113 RepID=UPI0036234B5D